jgi:nucleotide-binding universal stress UspA family protein
LRSRGLLNIPIIGSDRDEKSHFWELVGLRRLLYWFSQSDFFGMCCAWNLEGRIQERQKAVMPTNFKKILCPVDFSQHSREALAHAATFARASLGKLFLFHAIDLTELGPVLPQPHEKNTEGRVDLFHLALRRETRLLRSFAAGITAGCDCELIVEWGEPYKRILEIVQEKTIDLIVMGTHGRKGISHLAMGSLAEKVVRTAPCPVLTLHAPEGEARRAG